MALRLRENRFATPTAEAVPSVNEDPSQRQDLLTLGPVGILLQDVVIRHPGDVVRDHAGHTLFSNLRLAGNR